MDSVSMPAVGLDLAGGQEAGAGRADASENRPGGTSDRFDDVVAQHEAQQESQYAGGSTDAAAQDAREREILEEASQKIARIQREASLRIAQLRRSAVPLAKRRAAAFEFMEAQRERLRSLRGDPFMPDDDCDTQIAAILDGHFRGADGAATGGAQG